MEVYGKLNINRKANKSDLGYIKLRNARSSYPESKRFCESYCNAYSEEHNMNIKVVRLAQTFGLGISISDNRVFAQLTKSVIAKKI